jgi:hypothetical protein
LGQANCFAFAFIQKGKRGIKWSRDLSDLQPGGMGSHPCFNFGRRPHIL